eukprot:3053117-Pleurochrysis_carterae.AAC.1
MHAARTHARISATSGAVHTDGPHTSDLRKCTRFIRAQHPHHTCCALLLGCTIVVCIDVQGCLPGAFPGVAVDA